MSVKVPSIREQHEEWHGFEESGKFGESGKFDSTKSASGGFVRPKLKRKGSETEQRLAAMRERFTALQSMDEADDSPKDSPLPAANTASARWTKLRKVVNWPAQPAVDAAASSKKLDLKSVSVDDGAGIESPRTQSGKTSPRQKRKILKRPSEGSMKKQVEEEKAAAIELEDVSLGQIWTANELPEVPEPARDLPALSLVSEIDALKSDMYTNIFTENSKQLKVTVSRIPEAVVNERKAAIEKQAQEERLIMLDKLRKREEDIDFRENTAREALRAKEQEARRRLDAEKQKVASLALRKQKNLAQDFRKMREDLEAGIRHQQGAIKENFGKLLVHEETLARRFHAASKMAPQPVEFRIHMMRAVKNKLPKGNYVLMLTQYDSVGGRPLSWSRIGANGIGNLRPGITKMCRHEGRYFDRVLRVEDSCFALCPPRPLLRPYFVFVLELFQLAGRHNPFDRIEAWTAIPMTYESMSIIEGKFRLPMMRGEHSPAVRQFKEMETLIGSDLHNWLCNIYVEVRHMSLTELGATDEMLKTTDFDMDYFNKSFVPLDVDGNPILSRAQQEELALERELEAAGFTAAAQESQAGSPTRVKVPIRDESDADYEVPLLPVDKGIFRRKGAHAAGAAAGGGGGGDEEQGAGAGGAAGSSGPVAMNLSLNISGADKDKNDSGSETGSTKKRLTPKSSRLAPIPEGKLRDSSSHSLMSLIGLKASSDSSRPLLLKNDDNFLEHRKLLVQRWKENIQSKGLDQSNHTASFREEKQEEVLERGYNIQDEIFLHREQRGKIAGVETIADREGRQWATAGLEGKVVRRWQSEGPRFDSEAIEGDVQPAPGSPRIGRTFTTLTGVNNLAAGRGEKKEHTWEELRDNREMEDYSVAVCTDAGKKKGAAPGAKSASKLRYIYMELFGDFNHYLWGTFEFYMAVFVYLFALWIRIYVHYLAQFLYLESLGSPVYSFRLMVFQVVFKYMSSSISVAAETGVVAIGPIANLCLFLIFLGLGAAFHQFADYLPDVISKFFAAYGIAAVLDPLLVIIIDLIYRNYNCTARSDACKEDYTSSDCNCFNGDFLKLWYRMEREEGSGLTGLFIMILLYMGTIIIGSLMLYHYIVHVHRDGRILDQWRRVNATDEEFFIPHDFEVSDEELKTIVYKAVHWRGPKGSRRHLETQEYSETDPSDPYFGQVYKKFLLVEVDDKGNKSIFREFLLEPSGAILEIFESRNANKNNTSIFSSVINKDSEHVDQTDKEEGGSKDEDGDGEHDGNHGAESPSEHTGDHSARRSQASSKHSPRGAGAYAGSAFSDLLSFGASKKSSQRATPPQQGSRDPEEHQPLLRVGSSKKGLLMRPREPEDEDGDGQVYF